MFNCIMLSMVLECLRQYWIKRRIGMQDIVGELAVQRMGKPLDKILKQDEN